MPIMDPYKVLGVPTTATDDQVKQAYRRLAKKYHPDANPNDRSAEQRMKEINAAYDQIVNGGGASAPGYGSGYGSGSYTNNGGFGSNGNDGGYGGWSGGYEGNSSDARMNAARNYITFGHYQEALNVLAGIRERDALWYYYSAIANNGIGNKIVAIQHAQRAVDMEPGNATYAQLLNELQNPGRQYAGYGRDFSAPFLNLNRTCGGFLISWLMCMYCNFCCR